MDAEYLLGVSISTNEQSACQNQANEMFWAIFGNLNKVRKKSILISVYVLSKILEIVKT